MEKLKIDKQKNRGSINLPSIQLYFGELLYSYIYLAILLIHF